MAVAETTPLLPQEQSNPDYTPDEDLPSAPPLPTTFAARLNARDGFTLLVTIVIGSGIFSSPGPVDANVPSPGASLLIWSFGGLLAWAGALTLAELGTAIPGPGGIQPYLSYVFGEFWGYAAAWSWVCATMPATLAIDAIVFVESIYSSLDVVGCEWEKKGVCVAILLLTTALNAISTRTSTRLSGLFVLVKLLSVFLLVVAGVVVVAVYVSRWTDLGGGDWRRRHWFANRETVLPDGGRRDWNQVGMWEAAGYYSTALYGALWAYSGWDKVCRAEKIRGRWRRLADVGQANYVAAELRNPTKQLPLAINTAIPTIILCYIAANTVYYILLPWDVVSTTDAAAVVSH